MVVAPASIVPSLQTTNVINADHLLLAAAWLSWCIVHSLLISLGWMSLMRRHLGSRIAYYRLLYVVFSIVTFFPILWFQWTIQSPLLWEWTFPWALLQWGGVLLSLLIFYLGSREYDNSFFLGLRQIRDHRDERTSDFSGFATTGILGLVRHPYYSAGILFLVFWGDITAANLIMKVVGVVYLVVGAILEEKKLLREFGDEYRRYQSRVPMLVPRMRLKRNPESGTHHE